MSDRRALFFIIAAGACFVLAPVAHAEFRGFAILLGTVYVVLSAASLLTNLSRSKPRRRG